MRALDPWSTSNFHGGRHKIQNIGRTSEEARTQAPGIDGLSAFPSIRAAAAQEQFETGVGRKQQATGESADRNGTEFQPVLGSEVQRTSIQDDS